MLTAHSTTSTPSASVADDAQHDAHDANDSEDRVSLAIKDAHGSAVRASAHFPQSATDLRRVSIHENKTFLARDP